MSGAQYVSRVWSRELLEAKFCKIRLSFVFFFLLGNAADSRRPRCPIYSLILSTDVYKLGRDPGAANDLTGTLTTDLTVRLILKSENYFGGSRFEHSRLFESETREY
jgi:hypothetical protein